MLGKCREEVRKLSKIRRNKTGALYQTWKQISYYWEGMPREEREYIFHVGVNFPLTSFVAEVALSKVSDHLESSS